MLLGQAPAPHSFELSGDIHAVRDQLNMPLAFTPYLLPELIAAFAAAALATAARRSQAPGTRAFVGLLVAVAWWSLLYALELATVDPTLKLVWAKLEYPAIVATPPAFLIFAAQYTRQDRWLLHGRRRWLLAIVPLITLVLDWTDEWHGLMHSTRELDRQNRLAGA